MFKLICLLALIGFVYGAPLEHIDYTYGWTDGFNNGLTPGREGRSLQTFVPYFPYQYGWHDGYNDGMPGSQSQARVLVQQPQYYDQSAGYRKS